MVYSQDTQKGGGGGRDSRTEPASVYSITSWGEHRGKNAWNNRSTLPYRSPINGITFKGETQKKKEDIGVLFCHVSSGVLNR